MIKFIISYIVVNAFIFASVYSEGDIVSSTHQNITKSTCYSGNEYDVNDEWKLADWNGATNGGHYTVIFMIFVNKQ